MKRIYAILDTVSDMIIGSVLMFPHDAPAVRFFGELCADPATSVGRHTKDHQLVCLGYLTEQNQLVAFDRETVITGQSWLDAQPQSEQGVLPVRAQA